MRLVRRAGPLLLGAVALGTGAFFVARALKGAPVVVTDPVVPSGTPSMVVSAPRPSAERSASTVASAPASSERPTIALGAVKPATPAAGADAGANGNGKKRNVVIASLQPAFGVVMTVDGVRVADPGPGLSFPLPDQNAHVLAFTCKDERTGNELCVPKTVTVAAGDAEQTLDVQLMILPAKLLIDGDPLRSYTVEEANITLAAGVATEIPMRRGSWTVHIYDRVDPEKRKTQQLVAGQQHVVSFKNP